MVGMLSATRAAAHPEHSAASRAADGVAAKGVEVDALRHDGCDLGRRHDRGQRRAVADALRHRDDVRRHALPLKAPEVATGATKAGLHLVGDAQAAGLADRLQGRTLSGAGARQAAATLSRSSMHVL